MAHPKPTRSHPSGEWNRLCRFAAKSLLFRVFRVLRVLRGNLQCRFYVYPKSGIGSRGLRGLTPIQRHLRQMRRSPLGSTSRSRSSLCKFLNRRQSAQSAVIFSPGFRFIEWLLAVGNVLARWFGTRWSTARAQAVNGNAQGVASKPIFFTLPPARSVAMAKRAATQAETNRIFHRRIAVPRVAALLCACARGVVTPSDYSCSPRMRRAGRAGCERRGPRRTRARRRGSFA